MQVESSKRSQPSAAAAVAGGGGKNYGDNDEDNDGRDVIVEGDGAGEPSLNRGDDILGDDDDDDAAPLGAVSISPAYYYASLFLLITTLLQVVSNSRDEAGPLDRMAEVLLPKLFANLYDGGADGDGDGGVGICPPDEWVDGTFAVMRRAAEDTGGEGPSGLYSPEFDPRKNADTPTLFPHCAISRWVEGDRNVEAVCGEGEEHVTVIRPAIVTEGVGTKGTSVANEDGVGGDDQDAEVGGKIPRIIHLSSPTNCLPTSTVQALRDLITRTHDSENHHGQQRQHYTIYVHSHAAMDNFLFQREWSVFPQVREAVLCGMGKISATVHETIKELKLDKSRKEAERMANDVALGVKRDVWRLMILWEYGGIVSDVDTVTLILTEASPSSLQSGSGDNNNSSSTADLHRSHFKGYRTLQTLIRQWNDETSDGLLYFYNNEDRQRMPFKERVPLTELMGFEPRHPLVYYAAKLAMKAATWDSDVSIIIIFL